MSARAPRVSVCLPVYNGANYLAESIDSVLAQTFEDFRLIVVDNCSTDATPDIVKGFADRRIIYRRNPTNLGLVANHNRGLSLADGEFVCVWHHDDVMLPTNLAEKVEILDRHPTVGFVHSNLWTVDAAGRPLSRHHWHEGSRRDYVSSGLDVFHRSLAYLPRGAVVFMGSMVARRAHYERLGGFRAELPDCCDCEMAMRLALFGDVACLGTPLVRYRVHPAGVSRAIQGPVRLRERHAVARLLFDRYGARIPNLQVLRRETRQRFALWTMFEAAHASYSGDFALSREYLSLALRRYPEALGTRAFWWFVLRWAAGDVGTRLYGRVRKRLGR